MNNREYTRIVRFLETENRAFSSALRRIDFSRDDYPGSAPPFAVWRSNRILVQVFQEDSGPVRITVNRTMINRDGSWIDGLTWDDLQTVKREVGFGKCFAVEVFPEDSHVVNDANMRHLWVLGERLPFAWTAHNRRMSDAQTMKIAEVFDEPSESGR